MQSLCSFELTLGVGALFIGLGQILSFFSYNCPLTKMFNTYRVKLVTLRCWDREVASMCIVRPWASGRTSDDFNFNITNFPSWVAIFPVRQPLGFLYQQLLRYVRACSSYECFILGRCKFHISFRTRICQVTVVITALEILWSIWNLIKQYEVSRSQM